MNNLFEGHKPDAEGVQMIQQRIQQLVTLANDFGFVVSIINGEVTVVEGDK